MITQDNVVDLLSVVTSYDRRKAGVPEVVSWHEALSRAQVGMDEAVEAVHRHFSTSTDYLMPANVIMLVKAIRQDRAREAQRRGAITGPPPARKPPPEWFSSWWSAVRRGEADVHRPPQP